MQERGPEPSGKKQVSGTRGRSATCLHIAVSVFFFIPHVFQRYSPPPRINSVTITAPMMPHKGTALVSQCEPVSLTQREWRMLRQVRTWDTRCWGEIESRWRGQRTWFRSWVGGHGIHSSRSWAAILKWARRGHPRGRLRRYKPKSAGQRNCSAAELYTLYTGLSGDLLKVMCNVRLEGGVGLYHPGRTLHSR